jgi:hypothetical protein
MNLIIKKELYVHRPISTTLYVEYEIEHEMDEEIEQEQSVLPRYKKRRFSPLGPEIPAEELARAIENNQFINWADEDFRSVLKEFLGYDF